MVRKKTAEYVYTGKACKNGHTGPRYKNGNCVECLLNREKAKISDPIVAQQKRERERQRYWADQQGSLEKQKQTREKYGSEWNATRRSRYQTDSSFREKILASVSKYREANPLVVKKSHTTYHLKNKEARNIRSKEYRNKYREILLVKGRVLSSEHYQNNKEYYWIKNQKRRAVCAQATPKWANHLMMMQLKREAADASAMFGEPFSVDHIVPLKGVNKEGIHIVSGLNWEGNMRIIPLVENKSKGNRFWENMP